MSLDRDVALVGTGLAPLLAAQVYLRKGWQVLILNPDHDFFVENSELPFDPEASSAASGGGEADVLSLLRLDRSRSVLAPEFPGSIETWSKEKDSEFFDPLAPFLRARTWNWISARDREALYLKTEDLGWHPQLSEGVVAARRIPGFTLRGEVHPGLTGLSVARMADVDVERYRNGVLEFVRSRMPSEDWVTSASSIEPTPDGVRFYQNGAPRTVRLRQGLRVFRTPRLNSWWASLGHEEPLEWRAWEEWTLISRDSLDPSQIAFVNGASLWARCEGAPSGAIHELGILAPVVSGERVADRSSFDRLGFLAQRILNWDRFSVRDLKERRISLHDRAIPDSGTTQNLRWMLGADGALVKVVDRVLKFCAGDLA